MKTTYDAVNGLKGEVSNSWGFNAKSDKFLFWDLDGVKKIVIGELDCNNNLALKSIDNELYSLCHIYDIEPITIPKTDKEKAIELYITQQPPLTVNEAELIKNAFSAGAVFKPLTVENSFIQTLAQAYKFCEGEVPHRHNDVLIGNLESNIIAFVTPCIKNLFYLTFPKDRVIPDGYKYFCTVQEFVDFVPPLELIDGKAYQFDYKGRSSLHGIHCESECTFITRTDVFKSSVCTNIQPLTVEVK